MSKPLRMYVAGFEALVPAYVNYWLSVAIVCPCCERLPAITRSARVTPCLEEAWKVRRKRNGQAHM